MNPSLFQKAAQSGRTTAMLREAIALAKQGTPVVLVFCHQKQAEAVRTKCFPRLTPEDPKTLDIRFETPNTLNSTFSWETLRDRKWPDSVFLIDHHCIEMRFGAVFEMLHRFNDRYPCRPEHAGRWRYPDPLGGPPIEVDIIWDERQLGNRDGFCAIKIDIDGRRQLPVPDFSTFAWERVTPDSP